MMLHNCLSELRMLEYRDRQDFNVNETGVLELTLRRTKTDKGHGCPASRRKFSRRL